MGDVMFRIVRVDRDDPPFSPDELKLIEKTEKAFTRSVKARLEISNVEILEPDDNFVAALMILLLLLLPPLLLLLLRSLGL